MSIERVGIASVLAGVASLTFLTPAAHADGHSPVTPSPAREYLTYNCPGAGVINLSYSYHGTTISYNNHCAGDVRVYYVDSDNKTHGPGIADGHDSGTFNTSYRIQKVYAYDA